MSNKPFDWKPAYLAALRQVPVIKHACEAAGIDRTTAWRAREADEEFAKAEQEAMEEGIDRAEAEAFRRGIVGFEEPVIDKGRLAYRYERYEEEDVNGIKQEKWRMCLDENGQPIPLTVRKHSDAMLGLVLKGRRKNVYSERKELTGADGAALPAAQVIIATGVPSDDFGDLA